jgi:site-specific recombinase XerD
LSFNKVVVTRFRIILENRGPAAGTINGRLAAVRRLAYEAADTHLLSPELAAGICRVKGVRKFGVRLGNWLTAGEARRLCQAPDANTLKGKRDRAILAVLLGCGLRRQELADLNSRIFSSVRNIGRLSIWAKAGISGQFLCRTGLRRP